MGFLDEMASKAVSGLGGSSKPVASTILEMINNQPGGLSGLVQRFHEKGLGELVTSWISTGRNLPTSSDQIQHVLGNEQVQQFAAKAGISPDLASSKLAELLPLIVDRLTPDGQIPQQSSLLQSGMDLLKSMRKTGTTGQRGL